MNKIKTILFLVMTILMIMSVNVFAAEHGLEIVGDSEAKAGETKTLTVKLVSEEDMGVFSGKVTGDDNISKIEVTGKNNWNVLAFENGSFKLVKTQGGKNEDALEISYTINSEATEKAVITLSNIDLTTIDYKTNSIADVAKEITIKEDVPVIVALTGLEITKAPTKVKYEAGEKFSKDGMEITATYSDGTRKVITDYTYTPNGALLETDTKVVITYTENDVTKTVEQAITVEKKAQSNTNTTNNNTTNNNTTNNNTTNNNTTNNNTTNNNTTNNNTNKNVVTIIGTQKDNTVANKDLSKAGMSDMVFFVTMAVAILGTVFYIKYNKMKEIK